MDAVAKRARKRMYDQKHYSSKRDEFSRLQKHVAGLEEFAEKLRYLHRGRMPWKEVAVALHDDTAEAVATNASLKKALRHYEHLATTLAYWVHHATPLQRSPSASINDLMLRQTSLPRSDEARHTAVDWLTQQLYFHVPHMVAASGLPNNSLEPYFNIDVHGHGDTYVQSACYQCVVDVGLSAVGHFLHTAVINMEGYAEDVEPGAMPANTVYRRFVTPVQSDSGGVYQENTLMREFVQQDRIVVVVQVVAEDEKYPNRDTRRDWTQWYVAERLGPHRTLVRQGMVAAGLRNRDGYLPVEECSSYRHAIRAIADPIRREATYRDLVRRGFHGQFDQEMASLHASVATFE